ncbi:DUF4442 domain-containing protein [Nitrincola schmidtii]|uniref:DUF4442 domain-containing protein n=1 Tax=Nitrincola schmidtii TaxID=1730894 RepID=UPI00124DE321|nr:DUF4442 domain-containing protein [Nitrincola schmidtii]
MKAFFFRHPWLFRLGMNLWPPMLFCGIKLVELSKDFRYARVDLKWKTSTRNINGSQYGGSLFSMTDPFYALLLFGCLGFHRYHIWDSSAEIDFISPGIGRLTAEFHLNDEQLHEIRQKTAEGDKFFPEFVVYIKDQQGTLVAKVTRRVYVRLKSKYRNAS